MPTLVQYSCTNIGQCTTPLPNPTLLCGQRQVGRGEELLAHKVGQQLELCAR